MTAFGPFVERNCGSHINNARTARLRETWEIAGESFGIRQSPRARTIFPSAIFAISDCSVVVWGRRGIIRSVLTKIRPWRSDTRLLFHLQLFAFNSLIAIRTREALCVWLICWYFSRSKNVQGQFGLAPQSRQLSQVLSFNENARIRFNYDSIFLRTIWVYISFFSLAPHFLIAALRCGAAKVKKTLRLIMMRNLHLCCEWGMPHGDRLIKKLDFQVCRRRERLIQTILINHVSINI